MRRSPMQWYLSCLINRVSAAVRRALPSPASSGRVLVRYRLLLGRQHRHAWCRSLHMMRNEREAALKVAVRAQKHLARARSLPSSSCTPCSEDVDLVAVADVARSAVDRVAKLTQGAHLLHLPPRSFLLSSSTSIQTADMPDTIDEVTRFSRIQDEFQSDLPHLQYQ